MDKRSEICKDVISIIRNRLPSSLNGVELTEDVSLFNEGLGLDSVAIVELFLILEEYFNVPFTVDLIEEGPLTFGSIADHICRAKGSP